MTVNKKFVKDTLITALVIFIATLSGKLMPLSDATYLHIGDAFVYIAAVILPTPVSMLASAVGCAAADIVMGSYIYIIPTLIIKPLTVLAVVYLGRLVKNKENGDFAVCLAGVVTVVGYFVAEALLWIASMGFVGSVTAAATGILFNILQALASAVVFLMLSNHARRRYEKLGQPRPRRRKKKNEKVESTEE